MVSTTSELPSKRPRESPWRRRIVARRMASAQVDDALESLALAGVDADRDESGPWTMRRNPVKSGSAPSMQRSPML